MKAYQKKIALQGAKKKGKKKGKNYTRYPSEPTTSRVPPTAPGPSRACIVTSLTFTPAPPPNPAAPLCGNLIWHEEPGAQPDWFPLPPLHCLLMTWILPDYEPGERREIVPLCFPTEEEVHRYLLPCSALWLYTLTFRHGRHVVDEE